MGWVPASKTDDGRRRLSKRRPLKFIDDWDTNSILVTGADEKQLKTIEELIAAYDIPLTEDAQAMRLTRTYLVRHSKARVIADAVKEVYRDLLSVNDPAMQQAQNGKKDDRSGDRAATSYIFNYGGPATDDKKPDPPVRFKGALSLGIDELSNTLIVSASEGLLNSVLATIKELDERAKPTVPRMQVLKIDRTIDPIELQQKLQKLVVKPQPPQAKPGQQQQQPNGRQPGQAENGEGQVIQQN
jgi:hypothetical protein